VVWLGCKGQFKVALAAPVRIGFDDSIELKVGQLKERR
jgi:hypothetical protein